MQIRKSFNKAIFILLMLALSKNQEPLPSYIMSWRLKLSNSYLKKVLHQLVLAHLINSEAGKKGGFSLAKKIDYISLLDIYNAIEGKKSILKSTGLTSYVFFDKQLVKAKEQQIRQGFKKISKSFKNSLQKQKLGSLLGYDYGKRKQVDWKKIRNL